MSSGDPSLPIIARESQGVQNEIDELAWNDSARTTIAVQCTGIVMAWAVYTTDIALRPYVLAGCCVYASITLNAQRSRRILAAPLQVLIALFVFIWFDTSSKRYQRRFWKILVLVVYLIECFGWQECTSDLIDLAFARFQKQLFITIIVACVWSLPALYAATERLEAEQQAPGFSVEAEIFRQQIAGTSLYGGTALLLTVSGAIWIRLYRVAPELFRLLLVILLSGFLAGGALAFMIPVLNELQVITGAATAAFIAMAYCILHDKRAAHFIHINGILLFVSFLIMSRERFAAIVFLVQVINKFYFIIQLHALGSRRPRILTGVRSQPQFSIDHLLRRISIFCFGGVDERCNESSAVIFNISAGAFMSNHSRCLKFNVIY